jgi:hypothetical protein
MAIHGVQTTISAVYFLLRRVACERTPCHFPSFSMTTIYDLRYQDAQQIIFRPRNHC